MSDDLTIALGMAMLGLLVLLAIIGAGQIAANEAARPDMIKTLCTDKGWSASDCQSILDREIWVGMTTQQAQLSWGAPLRVNLYNAGAQEQWVYENTSYTYYVYFRNNILTSWTRMER